MTSLTLCKTPSVFPTFLNVGVWLYIISPNLHKLRLSTGILNVALGWTSNFSQLMKDIKKKTEFSRSGPALSEIVDQSMLFTHLYLMQEGK